ncbi:MAG: AAA family ATPase [Prevotella sp.]|nr:AAA family ATPase [Prevotella sp.]
MKENRDIIKSEFKYYLANVARSSRRTSEGFNLGNSAVSSFVTFIEPKKLFDYAPEKWQHIESMYDITDPEEVKKITNELLNDKSFMTHDSEDNQQYRSGALMHYTCFINARSFFLRLRGKKVTSPISVGQKSGNLAYRPYITAIKSKPFLLLAGISGTGKSRIVRELARACWDDGSEEYKAQKPKNFEMVQVKPNWHDSSELIGYVSRVSGSPVFVAGDFLKFVAKAWENPEVPYFLCLDEMNLAPVEQYFAEYLSVVESRKCDENGAVTTDPILKKCEEQWYFDLTAQLTTNDAIRTQFNTDGIAIPQNLIVVGTVNMDETTFSFSRKVLDRAMTIEMNEVDLYGGLTDRYENIGKLEAGNLIGTAVEGVDVYQENKDVCDTALQYLEAVNGQLEGTPFKVAYRTRNEFLLYVVNNLPYNKDKDGKEILQKEVIARALDEITSMKILSRIEGDETKIGTLLDRLETTIRERLKAISEKEYSSKKDENGKVFSVSLAKLAEMKKRLESGYTSFWS